MSDSLKRLAELATKQDLKPFREAWAYAVVHDSHNIRGLLDAISGLESQGQFQEAATCLKVLLPVYMESNRDQEALQVLKRLAQIAPRETGLRRDLLKVFKRLHHGNPALDAMIKHSGLDTAPDILGGIKKFESFLVFAPGSYVEHANGWGVGVVQSVDSNEATITVDFRDMPGHQLSLEMAQRITRHLDHGHFRAMKFDRMDQLLAMAENDAVALIRKAVIARERHTTVRDLRDMITDGIVPAKEWSRWWTRAKPLIKRDNNIKLGTGNNPSIEVSLREASFEETTLTHLGAISELPAKVKFVRELFNELDAHPETKDAILRAAAVLTRSSDEVRRKYPGATLSLALMLEKVAEVDGGFEIPEDLATERLLSEPGRLLQILDTVPIISDRKELLARVRARFSDEWPDVFERALYIGENDIGDYCLRELISIGAFDRLTRVIFDLLKRFRENRLAFVWYVRVAFGGKLHKALPNPGVTSLFEKLLLCHSHVRTKFLQTEVKELRDEYKYIEKMLQNRSYEFVRETLSLSDAHDAQRFYNMVRTSRSLPDDIKDGMIAAILRTRPEVARERAEAEETANPFFDERYIYVSRAGYLRFEAEFNKLVNDEIPRNAKEIGRAASFGDLSENAEWTAALEKQTMLSRRAEDMRAQLDRARVIDAATVTGESVSVGCRVTLRNRGTEKVENYILLGPWDADMDKGIISYVAPLGRALLGKARGEIAVVELQNSKVEFLVEDIVADALTDAPA